MIWFDLISTIVLKGSSKNDDRTSEIPAWFNQRDEIGVIYVLHISKQA